MSTCTAKPFSSTCFRRESDKKEANEAVAAYHADFKKAFSTQHLCVLGTGYLGVLMSVCSGTPSDVKRVKQLQELEEKRILVIQEQLTAFLEASNQFMSRLQVRECCACRSISGNVRVGCQQRVRRRVGSADHAFIDERSR